MDRTGVVSLLLNLWIVHLTVNKKESRFPQSSESDALPEQQIPEGVLRQRLVPFLTSAGCFAVPNFYCIKKLPDAEYLRIWGLLLSISNLSFCILFAHNSGTCEMDIETHFVYKGKQAEYLCGEEKVALSSGRPCIRQIASVTPFLNSFCTPCETTIFSSGNASCRPC